MDAVPERNIVCELVQFAVDGEHSRTGIRVKREPVDRRDHGIRESRISVREKFQDGDARARYRSVACRICGMRRRTFREGLGQEVAAVTQVAEVQGAGIEDDVEIAEFGGVGGVQLAGFQELDDSPARFGAVTEVDSPFLIPNRVDGGFCDRADRSGDIRPAECTEGLVVLVSQVRTSRIRRQVQTAANQIGDEIGLIELVDLGRQRQNRLATCFETRRRPPGRSV